MMSREEGHGSCRKLARGPWILGKTTNRAAVAADYLANQAAVAADYLANRAAVAADYSTNRAAVAADYSVFIPVCLPRGLIPSGSEAHKKKGAEAVRRHSLAVREAMRVICRARGWQVDCNLAWLCLLRLGSAPLRGC